MLLPSLLQDLRYGTRMLGRNARFTAVAVFTLALGIGVNSAAITAYKAIIGRSIDARDRAHMLNIALVLHSGNAAPWFSYPDYLAFRDQARSFSGIVAQVPERLILTGAGESLSQRDAASGSLLANWGLLPSGHSAGNSEYASTLFVSENYFSVLGVPLQTGRAFEAIDSKELASSPVALISENYWQRRFGGDPAILGKVVRLNGVPVTIIGITPHDFVGGFVAAPDFWLPLSLEPLLHPGGNPLHDRENQCCRLFARLAPGAGIGKAQAEMTLIFDHLRTLHNPDSELSKPATVMLWPGSPFPRKLDGALRLTVLLVLAAAAMVLVIACANVASLQLARTASRLSELGMRLSLGATRLRVVRQLLTESALLSLLAGAVALFFTWALLRIGVSIFSRSLPVEYGSLVLNVAPDLGVFAYVLALSLLAGILFGLAPALENSGIAVTAALKSGAGATPNRGRRTRGVLIAAQVAVSVVLLIAGSMLIRSSIQALRMDTGYDTHHVVSLSLQCPEGSGITGSRKTEVVREIRTAIAALPGAVEIAGGKAPDNGDIRSAAISLDGEKPSARNTRASLTYRYVQPNYFRTVSIPLLFGRGFQPEGNQPCACAIVSESAAHILWPGRNPIGLSLRLGTIDQYHASTDLLPDGPNDQVIGVVHDTRGVMLDGSDAAVVYLPMPDNRVQDFPLLIRTRLNPAQLMNAIGNIVAKIDPDIIATSATLEQLLRQTTVFLADSFAAAIASTIGFFGLLLAAIGIYGTVSYVVVLRTREVGIRMALGARKHQVAALMLRDSSRPVLAGLLVGLVLAAGDSYLLRGILYGLGRFDVVSFVGVAALLLVIAWIAAYLPSRRAMRVDPMVALRCE